MAWNQPGGSDKDPWNNPNRKGSGGDLDKMLKDAGKKVGGIFGKGGNTGGGKSFWIPGIIVLALLYIFNAAYTIDQKERGVVLRFGEYLRTDQPGLHFVFPPMDRVHIVDVESVREVDVRGTMLTQDDNVGTVQIKVQYRVSDPLNYLFNVKDPDNTMYQVTESALRQVIGHTNLTDARTRDKEKIRANIGREINAIIEPYKTGLSVLRVNLLGNVDVPREVRPAFDDAIKAEEDEAKFKNQAEAYRNKKLPLAEGNAERKIQEAEAYLAQVTERARGEVARFEKLLPEYRAAPEVTRERLYLETMEQVLSSTSKVVLDTEGGNNMTYLPLDKIIQKSPSRPPADDEQ